MTQTHVFKIRENRMNLLQYIAETDILGLPGLGECREHHSPPRFPNLGEYRGSHSSPRLPGLGECRGATLLPDLGECRGSHSPPRFPDLGECRGRQLPAFCQSDYGPIEILPIII
uniref:Uncharacterized protein n=1 Tax=Arion vulgaris TaxID=1028688 RepID=A0A0B6YPL0_9EUPU